MSLTFTAGQRISHVIRVDIAEKHINYVEKECCDALNRRDTKMYTSWFRVRVVS